MARPRFKFGLRTSDAIYSTVNFHQALNLCMAFKLALPPTINDDVKKFLRGFDPEKQRAIYLHAASLLNLRSR